MGGINPGDPCLDPVARTPLPVGERIRVLELMATGTNGGAQEHVYSLISRLDRERYEVRVVSLSPGSAARRIAELGVPTTIVEEPDDATAVGSVAALAEEFRADVIHNHMYRAELVGTRAAIALGSIGHRRPYVVSTIHSSRVRSAEDRAVMRRLTPEMDRVIAVSRAIEQKLIEEGRTGTEVSVIYNGVDLQRYDHQAPCCTLREEYGLPAEGPIVGVVARLESEKGHPTLLDAWPAVLAAQPTATLLIVGEGSRREELEAQARALEIAERVVFTGRREDVPAVTAALDVAVLPSYREAQGLVILEAMALGRPVVATRVGGIPEMVEDGVTGLLVPAHDSQALAAAIVRLLTDHSLADVIGRAGHDLVHDRFCVELMVSAVEDIYDAGAAAVRSAPGAR